MNETFRKLISEELKLDFVPRPNQSCFLISAQAFPQRVMTDDEVLLPAIRCFNGMGFTVDLHSIKPTEDDFTWLKMKRGDETFSAGISNAIKPPFYIIITVTGS